MPSWQVASKIRGRGSAKGVGLDVGGIAGWLKTMDGNTIYGHEVLRRAAEFGIKYNEKARTLRGGGTVKAPVFSSRTFRTRMRKRGLGGKVRNGDWTGVSGLGVAEAMCKLVGADMEATDEMEVVDCRFDACVDAILGVAKGE